ncbi:MAG: DUF4423 domain-containing protein [Proteobacteria bacterium]|nr:MAG: DUF4423 domain-containing protein [Pseudomonadota bacterium]
MEANPNRGGTVKEAEARASDLQSWAGNWIWRAVQTLVRAPDFNPSPKWVATRLNVSVEKALDALEGLERLGFITRDGAGGYAHTKEWVQLLPGKVTRAQLLNEHSKIAPQIITKLTAKDKFTTQFFIADQALVAAYAPKFIQLYRELNEEGLKLGLKEVFASEISFAQLTTPGTNAGGNT